MRTGHRCWVGPHKEATVSHINTLKLVDWFEDDELSLCRTCAEKAVPPTANANAVAICLNCGTPASRVAET